MKMQMLDGRGGASPSYEREDDIPTPKPPGRKENAQPSSFVPDFDDDIPF